MPDMVNITKDSLRNRASPKNAQSALSEDENSENAPFLSKTTTNGASSTPKSKTKTDAKGEQVRLLDWDELEPWQQDNRFLIRAYRPATNSYTKSIASLSYLHNQSVNIWSHLIGAIVFSIIGVFAFVVVRPRYKTADKTDVFVFACFFVGAAICLTLSTAFHTFGNHSDEVFKRGLLLDLSGIIILITASFMPGVYYGFYCEPTQVTTYWSMISFFGLGAAMVCLVPGLRHRSWDWMRTIMFVSMGCSGIAPMTHAALMFGIPQARRHMGWLWYVAEGVFYCSGAAIYAFKIPERLYPGRFDVFGASHQIFHIFVLIGAACHLTGAVKAFDYNHDPATRRC